MSDTTAAALLFATATMSIERLLRRGHRYIGEADGLMPGLAAVARALNAGDRCLARIAAVHLRLPDLPNPAARDAMEAEDSLIKYARDGGSLDWNPALHPRTGTPPNPGWFAPTGSESHNSPGVRVAENDDPTRRSDASSDAVKNWVHLPPGKYVNDELADFVEWIANARPEDKNKPLGRRLNVITTTSAIYTAGTRSLPLLSSGLAAGRLS